MFHQEKQRVPWRAGRGRVHEPQVRLSQAPLDSWTTRASSSELVPVPVHDSVHIKASSDLAYQVEINKLCASKVAPPTRSCRFTDGQTEASPIGLTGKSRNVAIIPRVGEQQLLTAQNGTEPVRPRGPGWS